jgi:thermitase
MSISGTAGSTTLQQAMNRASELGAVMSCAAGNNGNSQATYPANYSNCIAVAATTNQDQRASYSTFGTWVDVAAPGSNIYSTLIGNKYGQMSGTSMASPHVAGLAGLLWSRGIAVVRDSSGGVDAPKTAPSVRSRIESTADAISGTGRQWAKGRINACRAVKNTPSC